MALNENNEVSNPRKIVSGEPEVAPSFPVIVNVFCNQNLFCDQN